MLKLYISPHSWKSINSKILNSLYTEIGVEATPILSQTNYLLPLNDTELYNFSIDDKYAKFNYIDWDTLNTITDRDSHKNLNIPLLDHIIPKAIEDIENFPHDFIYTKRRRTYLKESNHFAYKLWQKSELLNSVTSDFWKYQTNPDPKLGEFIIQETFPETSEILGLNISVNGSSQVLMWEATKYITTGTFTYSLVHPTVDDCSELVNMIQTVVSNLNIKHSLHFVEFVKMGDTYKLLDWNARLSIGVITKHIPEIYPNILNRAIAHMLDIPYTQTLEYYHEARAYPHAANTINENVIAACGLIQRTDHIPNSSYRLRVFGCDINKENLHAKFAELERCLI